MLCEAFQRLGKAKDIKKYRYVGFGSMYYGDFILFHRILGIEHMTSIEHEAGAPRAEFNKPFSCIDVLAGRANAKLMEIKWKERPAIVWLDYDYGLNKEVLDDVAKVATNALPNSMLIVTLDATDKDIKNPPEDENTGIDLEEFETASLVGKINLKCGTQLPEDTDLRDDGIAKVYRDLINTEISLAINSTVDPRSGQPNVRYDQVFNFRYSDGRQMMTIGGVFNPIYPDGKAAGADFGFPDLDYSRSDDKIFEIEAPKLTVREIREMNRALPCADAKAIQIPIPDEDKILYQNIYRYFPIFTEAEL